VLNKGGIIKGRGLAYARFNASYNAVVILSIIFTTKICVVLFLIDIVSGKKKHYMILRP
jgi:hypothetical protein